MKKNTFLLMCLLIAQFIFAQSPGGVSTGLTAWFKSNQGVIGSPSVSQWQDLSGNVAFTGNNPSQATPALMPTLTTTGNLFNFNPYITFSGANNAILRTATNIQGTDLRNVAGKMASTYVVARSQDSNDGVFFDQGLTGNGNFICTWQRGTIGSSADVAYASTSTNQAIYTMIRPTTNVLFNYQNGKLNVSGAQNTATLSTSDRFYIGGNSAGGDEFNGEIAEIIIYNTDQQTSGNDKAKIESYLAIKYGISLDQTTATNYIASNSAVIWDATANSTYKNNIAGIGRDNASTLHQRQSQSQNAGVQPVIGNNSTILASNTAGAGDFPSDNNFETWGSDTGATSLATAFNFGGMNNRMARIWKIQETGTVGTVKVALKKSDFVGSNQSLIVSNDATFDGADTRIAMIEETIDGVVYYTATVNFTDGQFFTFGSFVTTPGGVGVANLAAWFKADAGTFSDAGITSATNGGAIQQWNDQSGNAYNLGQATVGDRPVYYGATANKLVNFNPSVDYVSADRLVNATRLMPVSSPHSFFGVTVDEATTTGYKTVFTADNSDFNYGLFKAYVSGNGVSGWMAYKGADYRLVNGTNANNTIGGNGFSPSGGSNGAWNGTTFVANTGTQPQVFGLLGAGSSNNSGVSFLDGYKTTNSSTSTSAGTTWFGRMTVGDFTGGGRAYTGKIPEIMAFNKQLSDNEAQRVNTYLAIKYGTTLGQGGVNIVNNNGNNYNYLASDATVIWNATSSSTYKFHIAGIGRDDASGLNQKQSQSQNTGTHVILGLGTVVASNTANVNTFTADKQFLLWGENGLTGAVGFSDPLDTSVFSRLNKVWFVDNSNSFNQNVQLLLPTSLLSASNNPKLIVSSTSAFTSGTNTYYSLSATTTINAVSYYVINLPTVVVANDFYFTATNIQAPGGVADDLRFWLNMSSFTPSNWSDLSGNSNNFLSTSAVRQPQALVATERVNFHPAVDFRQSSWGGNQKLMHKPAPGPFTANLTDGTIFSALSRESDAGYRDVIGFGDNANSGTVLTGSNYQSNSPVLTAEPSANHSMSLFPYRGPGVITTTPTNSSINQVLSTSKTHIPDITWRYNQANGLDYGLDGNEVNGAATPTAISAANGALIDGQGEPNDGKISELIGYERALTLAEKQKIRSYLALKYGVSQNQYVATNYVNSSGTIVWAAASNSAFGSDIAGIGIDKLSTLNQVMSKSVNNVVEPL